MHDQSEDSEETLVSLIDDEGEAGTGNGAPLARPAAATQEQADSSNIAGEDDVASTSISEESQEEFFAGNPTENSEETFAEQPSSHTNTDRTLPAFNTDEDSYASAAQQQSAPRWNRQRAQHRWRKASSAQPASKPSYGAAYAQHIAALPVDWQPDGTGSGFSGGTGSGTGRGRRGTGTGGTLRERVNGGFQDQIANEYKRSITRVICYELNKQNIFEAPCFLPAELALKVEIGAQGQLLDLALIKGSLSPKFDQELLRAVRAAAPFRPIPKSFAVEQFTFVFTIHPSHSMISNQQSRQRTPINFFMEQGPGQY